MIGGFRGAERGQDLPRRAGRRRAAALQARCQHRLPELRALPAHVDRGQRRVRARAQGRCERRARRPGERDPRARRALGIREEEAEAALGRPAAAGRTRTRAREPPARPLARRAARSARSEAPQAHAARAEGDPERGRDHVRPRHARPGGGDDDGGRDRGHEQRTNRATRAAAGALREARLGLRRRGSRSTTGPSGTQCWGCATRS